MIIAIVSKSFSEYDINFVVIKHDLTIMELCNEERKAANDRIPNISVRDAFPYR